MKTSRMEAFTDGVVAILITIMVLEMKVPHGADWTALRGIAPVFASYVMSFAYLGIYWNNHQHLIYVTERIRGVVLWANLHLLFWLSLVPFVTGWMAENDFAPLPTALYGAVLLISALAWSILQTAITADSQANTQVRQAVGRDFKGKLSLILYVAAIGLAFVAPWLSIAIYVLVALMWLVPDRRFETLMGGEA